MQVNMLINMPIIMLINVLTDVLICGTGRTTTASRLRMTRPTVTQDSKDLSLQ